MPAPLTLTDTHRTPNWGPPRHDSQAHQTGLYDCWLCEAESEAHRLEQRPAAVKIAERWGAAQRRMARVVEEANAQLTGLWF